MESVQAAEARVLRRRVVLLGLGAFAALLLGLLGIYVEETAFQRGRVHARLAQAAVGTADAYDTSLSDTEALVWAFAHSEAAAGAPSPECDRLAAELVERAPQVTNLGVMDARGGALCFAHPVAGTPTDAERAFYERALSSADVEHGDLVIGPVNGRPAVHLAYALRSEGTRRVVFGALDVAAFDPGTGRALPEGSSALLVGADGRLVWRWPDVRHWAGARVDAELLGLAYGPDDLFTTLGVDGVERVYAAATVDVDGEQDLRLLVGAPHESVTARARRRLTRNLIVVAGLALLGTGVGMWLGDRWIVGRAVMMADTMRRIREGDLSARVGASSGALEGELDHMAMALDALTAQNRLLLRSVGYPVLGTDDSARVTFANAEAERLLGAPFAQLVGRTLHDILHGAGGHSDHDCPLHAPLRDGRTVAESDHEVIGPDGPIRAELVASPLREDGPVRGIGLVMKERQSLDEAAARAMKLEVVERLSAGVAHDFNNLLAIVLGYAELLKRRTPQGSPEEATLGHILAAGERAAALTRRLMAFSRHERPEPGPIRVDEAVRGTCEVLRRIVGEPIALSVETAAPSCVVMSDPYVFEQILVNLALNARDAMPQGGRLTIRTCRSPVTPGGARVVVQDTGTGIPPDIANAMFEPFVTTKPRGTGLGLAIVKAYVDDLGGKVRAESGSEGTRFEIDLPCRAGADDAAPEPRRAHPEGAHVLLVEDEPALLEMWTQALREEGYRVTGARSVAEASAVLVSSEPIDVLVSDVVLPDGRGPALAARHRGERPGMRIVFTSGWSDVTTGDDPLLPKPLSPGDLARAVRELLSSRPAAER